MDSDALMEKVGEFGPWQFWSYLLFWIPGIAEGVHVLMYSFTGLQPPRFRCKLQKCDSDSFTFDDIGEEAFARKDDGTIDYCTYNVPKVNVTTENSCYWDSTEDNSITIGCSDNSEFTYGIFDFEETFVTQLDLVCGSQYKVAWVASAYMIGLMFGSFICGYLADRYGRRFVLIFSIIISTVGSLVGAFLPEYYSYTVSRFVTAVGAKGLGLAAFALSVEIVGAKKTVGFLPWGVKWKTVTGVMFQAPFAIGMSLLSVYAMFFKDWTTLQWTATLILLIQVPFWLLTPESPRWLVATHRYQQAEQLLTRIAKRNGKPVPKFHWAKVEHGPDAVGEKSENQSAGQYGIKDIFHPVMRLNTIILLIIWPVVTLGYYGITFSQAGLSDDIFLNNILGGLVEIPAYIIVALFMDVWGRKPLFSISLLFSGGSCIAVGFLTEGSLRTALALIGKGFAAGSFALVYMYSAELYPTTIRATAVGMFSFCARIGGFAAPQIALSLPEVTSDAAPYFVMGGCSVLGGLLTLVLPETLGFALPETVDDVENIKKNSKPFWTCVVKK